MRKSFALSSTLFLRALSTTPTKTNPILTPNELQEINSLILRLSHSNHFQESIRLLSVSLLADTCPRSLSCLPLLIDRITTTTNKNNNMSSSMYLLTTLRHHNPPHHLLFCSSLLISSFLRNNQLPAAAKVLAWLLRDDTPCRPDGDIYKAFVCGFWEKNGRALEVVTAVREMARDGLEVGDEIRGWVWDCMLREARVDDAKRLDQALLLSSSVEAGEFMDRMISEWQD